MAQEVTRARAIQSALLQVLGGVLILAGVIGSNAIASGWTGWAALLVSVYFLATGGYRAAVALQMPKD